MTTQASFDDIFAVMAAVSIGEAARVAVPSDASFEHIPTKFALALNLLLDDLAHRESELAAGEARFRALFAGCPLPMWVFDARTFAFLEVNEATEQQYGYRRDELLAMSVKDFRPAEDLAAFLAEMEAPLSPDHTSPARHRRKDGTLIHVELHRKAITHAGRDAWFVVANDVTERVRIEAARAKAESRFSQLSSSGLLGVIVRTGEGRVLEINETLARMVGYSREELLSGAVPWSSLKSEADHEADEASMADLLTSGFASLREKEYLRKDGTTLPVLLGAAKLEGTEDAVIAFVLDLTERKHAEAAVQRLREQRSLDKKFQALLESAPDAMVVVDKQEQITLVNAQTEKLFGYARSELVGQAAALLIPHGFSKPRDFSSSRELVGVRKDKTEFPIEISASPLETDEGMLVSSAIRDITDRVRKDEVRLRLSAIVDSSEDAIIGKLLDGTITSWNQGAARLFAYRADEMIGKPIGLLIPPGHENEEQRILVRLRRGEALHLETVRRRKDGTDIDVAITLSPVRSRSGEIIGASKVARDITERKRNEHALAVAHQELESFSYSVAHDLRAPLRGMNGFAQILLDDYADKLDEEGQDHLREIHGNTLRMGSMIDALLSLSRLTRSELTPAPTDLTSVARAVFKELAAADKSRQVEIVVADGLSAHIDARLGRNLLDNLIGNAWKFTGKTPTPRIEVGTMDRDGTRVFFVRDNGAGFDMTYAKKLFVPFQRLHASGDFQGTGIGLATAQRIVHRHGGSIWAEGQVDAGATIYFTLPGTSSS